MKGGKNIKKEELITTKKASEISAGSSARTRIYRIIIKQLFGNEVDIRQVGFNTFFSLTPIPKEKNLY
jgi:hypothetical protein